MTPKEMALTAAKALDEKKGGDIAAIEITEQTTLADYFVIATGNSNTQINALCGAVEKAMKEQAGEDPLRREGYRDGTWVLLDYGCICVHVFSAEDRKIRNPAVIITATANDKMIIQQADVLISSILPLPKQRLTGSERPLVNPIQKEVIRL